MQVLAKQIMNEIVLTAREIAKQKEEKEKRKKRVIYHEEVSCCDGMTLCSNERKSNNVRSSNGSPR